MSHSKRHSLWGGGAIILAVGFIFPAFAWATPCTSPTLVDSATCNEIPLSTTTPFEIQFGHRNYEVSFVTTSWYNLCADIFTFDRFRRHRSTCRPGRVTETTLKVRIDNRTTKNFKLMSSPTDGKIIFSDSRRGGGRVTLRIKEEEILSRFTFSLANLTLRADTARGSCLVETEAILNGQDLTRGTEDPENRGGYEPRCLWLKGRPGYDYNIYVHQMPLTRPITEIGISGAVTARYTLLGRLYHVFVTGLDGDTVTFSPDARPTRFSFFDDYTLTQQRWGRRTETVRRALEGDEGSCPRPEAGCDAPTDTGDAGSGEPAGEGACIPSEHEVQLREIQANLLMFRYRILPIRGLIEENRESGAVCFRADPNPFAASHATSGGDTRVIAPVAVRFSGVEGSNDIRVEYERAPDGETDPAPPSPAAGIIHPRGEVFATYIIKDACGRVPFIIAEGHVGPPTSPLKITVERIREECFVDFQSDEMSTIFEIPADAEEGDEEDAVGDLPPLRTERKTQREVIQNNLGSLMIPDDKACRELGADASELCGEGGGIVERWLNNVDWKLVRRYDSSIWEDLKDQMDYCGPSTLYFGCIVTWIPWLIGEIGCFFYDNDDCGDISISEQSRRLGVVVFMGQGYLDAIRLPQVNNLIWANRGEWVADLAHGNHIVTALGGQKAIRAGMGAKRVRTYTRGASEGVAGDTTLLGCGIHECQFIDGDGDEIIFPGAFFMPAQNEDQGDEFYADDPVEDDDDRYQTTLNFFKLGGGTHKSALPMTATDDLDDCDAGNAHSTTAPPGGLNFCKVAGMVPMSDMGGVGEPGGPSGWHGYLVKTDAPDYGQSALSDTPPPDVRYHPPSESPAAERFNAIWNAFAVNCLERKIFAQRVENLDRDPTNDEVNPLGPCEIEGNEAEGGTP